MYPVNTYRWDYAEVAALVAPRPLLISNTDKDNIFPLHGVVDVYAKTRRIYELYGKLENIGLQICEGPHKDTQQLRVHAFHWFARHLKGQKPSPLIESVAVKFFTKVCRLLTGYLRILKRKTAFAPFAGPSIEIRSTRHKSWNKSVPSAEQTNGIRFL